MKLIDVNLAYATSRRSSPGRMPETVPRPRLDEQVRTLVENVPKPSLGFGFSIDQRQQQAQFFKLLKDLTVPLDNVDLYDADMVAICKRREYPSY